MNHGTTAKKIFCPVWSDVELVANTFKVKRKLKKIYIQTITNDIDRDEFNIDDICSRVTEVLENLKNVIDEEDGEIYVSSLLPRADKMDIVENMNKALRYTVRSFSFVKFIEQSNIIGGMLQDKKHLNRVGFTTLLQSRSKCIENTG